MVFLVIASYPMSLITFRGKLISALQACGMEIHVASPDLPEGGSVRRLLEESGMRVHEIILKRTGTNPLVDLVTAYSISKAIRKVRPKYVLSYTAKPIIYGSIVAKLLGVDKIFALVTGLGFYFSSNVTGLRRIPTSLMHSMYRLALSCADKIFFQNGDDLNLLKVKRIVSDDSHAVVVNGSGVDLDEFEVAPIPQKISFLLTGRFLGAKGIREYAEAAKVIKREKNDVDFKIAGWIDDNPDAISKAELDKWIEEGVLDYLGHLRDVRRALSESSVFVLPSYREGMPRSVLEAMAVGRAIITTDAPGCRDTVEHGVNGYLVSTESVDELVQAMRRFVAEPGLVVSMGKRSREIALEKFDVNKINTLMIKEMGLT